MTNVAPDSDNPAPPGGAREPARRDRAARADWQPGWLDLLPDLMWLVALAFAVVTIIGLTL